MVKKEDITLVAQLLTSMKEASIKMEEAQRENNLKKLADAKKEILNFQREINKLL